MPRGGARLNSGPQPSWKHGRTTRIRVPRALAAEILRLARYLDESQLELGATSKVSEAVEILTGALKLKPNAGGAIKRQIREALEVLEPLLNV